MRTAQQRIDAYEARMQSSQIDPTVTAVADLAKANYATYINEFYQLQTQLRGILDGLGIYGNDVFLYEAYNGELYSIARRFSGTAADTMAQVIHDKYEALGLATANLVAIAATLYSITVT